MRARASDITDKRCKSAPFALGLRFRAAPATISFSKTTIVHTTHTIPLSVSPSTRRHFNAFLIYAIIIALTLIWCCNYVLQTNRESDAIFFRLYAFAPRSQNNANNVWSIHRLRGWTREIVLLISPSTNNFIKIDLNFSSPNLARICWTFS